MLFVLICMVYFELFRCRFNGDSSFNDDICFGLYSILWCFIKLNVWYPLGYLTPLYGLYLSDGVRGKGGYLHCMDFICPKVLGGKGGYLHCMDFICPKVLEGKGVAGVPLDVRL